MEHLHGLRDHLLSYIPTSAPDVGALIPNFLDANGNPRYGLIAATAGLATGATYFLLRASFTNRSTYPHHLMQQDQQPSPTQTQQSLDGTAAATAAAAIAAATTAAPPSPLPPLLPPPLPTHEPPTTTTTMTRTGPPAGPILLVMIVSVALVVSLSNTLSSDGEASNLRALFFWTWANQFPLFLPLFYAALGLVLHQRLFAQDARALADSNFDHQTTPPLQIVDASNAEALLKRAAPMPRSSPPGNVKEASKQQDDGDNNNDENNDTNNDTNNDENNENVILYRGETKGEGEAQQSLLESPSRPSRAASSKSQLLEGICGDLDLAWKESEEGTLDKKEVQNQVLSALEQFDSKPIGLLWRAARAESNIASWDPNISEEDKKNHVKHGLEYAEKCLNLLQEVKAHSTTITNHEKSQCHKFMAICLGQKTQFLSNPKEKLNLATEIKNSIDKGIQYNDNDPMLWYMSGSWKYNIADLSYAIRYGASWVTGVFLEAEFHEALNDFQKATLIDASFYSDNYFMTARTMLKLNSENNYDPNEIKAVIQHGLDMTEYNPSTQELQQKAKSLLDKC